MSQIREGSKNALFMVFYDSTILLIFPVLFCLTEQLHKDAVNTYARHCRNWEKKIFEIIKNSEIIELLMRSAVFYSGDIRRGFGSLKFEEWTFFICNPEPVFDANQTKCLLAFRSKYSDKPAWLNVQPFVAIRW